MIIMRSRSNTEIFTIVHGNVGVNELLTNLVQAVDIFQVRCPVILHTVGKYCYCLLAYMYEIYCFVPSNREYKYRFYTIIILVKIYRNKDELILALKKNGRPEKELSKNKTEHIKKVWQSIGNKKKRFRIYIKYVRMCLIPIQIQR